MHHLPKHHFSVCHLHSFHPFSAWAHLCVSDFAGQLSTLDPVYHTSSLVSAFSCTAVPLVFVILICISHCWMWTPENGWALWAFQIVVFLWVCMFSHHISSSVFQSQVVFWGRLFRVLLFSFSFPVSTPDSQLVRCSYTPCLPSTIFCHLWVMFAACYGLSAFSNSRPE